MATGARLDGSARGLMSTIFVADVSSEGEGLALALRAAGHTVVDVPPSMLIARVAVQHPRVVLVDADAEGALEVVERMRELPEAEDIHVLFIGRPGGAIASPEEALAHEGSGLFLRPVEKSRRSCRRCMRSRRGAAASRSEGHSGLRVHCRSYRAARPRCLRRACGPRSRRAPPIRNPPRRLRRARRGPHRSRRPQSPAEPRDGS